jgi:hypothetical protein
VTDRPLPADPAETLRRAAALMRQHAQAASPGPWISDDSDQCWRLHSAPDPHWPTMQILKAPKRHQCPQYEEYWPEPADARHITAWHPGVALTVANLLDAIRQGPLPSPDNGGNGLMWIMALRVAGAYLDTCGRDDE